MNETGNNSMDIINEDIVVDFGFPQKKLKVGESEDDHLDLKENMTVCKRSTGSDIISNHQMIGYDILEDDQLPMDLLASLVKKEKIFKHLERQNWIHIIYFCVKLMRSDKFEAHSFQIETIQQLVFSHYSYLEIKFTNDMITNHGVQEIKIEPRSGADGSVVDLPTGMGKTLTTLLGSLLYVLLDFDDLKNNYMTRCVMQVHNNATIGLDTTVYRNIIGICIPNHLVYIWEKEVDYLVEKLSPFALKTFGKVLKRYTPTSIIKMKEDIGVENEIAFVIFVNNGVSYHSLSFHKNIYEDDVFYTNKVVDDRIPISFPVLIEDESESRNAYFNKDKKLKLAERNYRLPQAAHYISVTSSPKLNSYYEEGKAEFTIHDYIYNKAGRSLHVSQCRMLNHLNLLYSCKTNYNLVCREMKNMYEKTNVYEVILKTIGSFQERNELNDFEKGERNFISFKNHAKEYELEIPDDFKFKFNFSQMIDFVASENEKTRNNQKTLRNESNETKKTIEKREAFLEQLVGRKDNEDKFSCPICWVGFTLDFLKTNTEGKKRKHSEIDGDVIFTTCCRTRYHKSCMDNWKSNKNICPQCRKKDNAMVELKNPTSLDDGSDDNSDVIPPLEDSSLREFSNFLACDFFEKKSQANGFIPYSIKSRSEKLILSLLHYNESFPQKRLKFLFLSEGQDMTNFKQAMDDLIPNDKKSRMTLLDYNVKSTRKTIIVEDTKNILKEFLESTTAGISILFCDLKKKDLYGLDFGEVDGIICMKKEENKLKRLGLICRLNNKKKDKEILYIQLG